MLSEVGLQGVKILLFSFFCYIYLYWLSWGIFKKMYESVMGGKEASGDCHFFSGKSKQPKMLQY